MSEVHDSSAASSAGKQPIVVVGVGLQSLSIIWATAAAIHESAITGAETLPVDTMQASRNTASRKGAAVYAAYLLAWLVLAIGLPFAIPPTHLHLRHAVTWPLLVTGLGIFVGTKCGSRPMVLSACSLFMLGVGGPGALYTARVAAAQQVARGVSVADWAAANALKEVFFFTDGYVETDWQANMTAFDNDMDAWRSYAIAPVFPSTECVRASGGALAERCEVAFYLLKQTVTACPNNTMCSSNSFNCTNCTAPMRIDDLCLAAGGGAKSSGGTSPRPPATPHPAYHP